MHAGGSIEARMAFDKGVTLYTAGTPNGWKANMIIEELNIPYKLHAIKLSDNEQKQDWFLKINPNGRIPAIGERLYHFEQMYGPIAVRTPSCPINKWVYMTGHVVQLITMKETCQSLNPVQS